ncbi:SPAG1, partial [Symbiodinium microadriaticum]
AKQQANALFSEGKTSDAERWFSKAIWVAEESGKVKEVPDSLRSVLHTNRAFARLKLKQWPGVEDDCTQALSFGASNAKALYRRAQARFELKQRQEALEDVEKLLPLLGPPSDKEALELREKILALPTPATEPAKTAAPASPKEASEPPPGFKRMQIVEASDSEEEAEPAKMSNGHGGEPPSPSKPATTSPAAREPPAGFRRLQIEEASDDEEPEPPKMSNGVSTPNGSAPPSPAKAEAKAAAERKTAETEVKKMPPEPYPEIKLEHTVAGAEKAKEEGNRLFAAGSIEESARWFSKAIWLVEESGSVTGVTATLRAILHSNRAFARLKMRQWADAEVDCSQALACNASNPKALYRRAMARKELQKYEAALADVEALLPMLDQAPSKDALDLREELLRLTAPRKEVPKAAPKEPAQKPPSPAGAASRAPAPAASASLPSVSPKSSMEMLRQLKSLKRHPTVMTQYVSERVPPALLQSLFSKSPIEADDLALVLECLRTAAVAEAPMPPATVGEYLQQLLRTNAAETQFSMLSTSEKQIVRELITLAPSQDRGELEKRFKRVLS